MAPQVGLEPTTLRLTAGCSAIELLRSGSTLICVLACHRNHIRGYRGLEIYAAVGGAEVGKRIPSEAKAGMKNRHQRRG
jgi:hypothetical protein